MATRLARALDELNEAMAGRPYLVVYDQAHKSQGRACVKGTFGGGFVAALGLAHLSPEFVRQLCSGDIKRDDDAEPVS